MKVDEIQILNYVEHRLDSDAEHGFDLLIDHDDDLKQSVLEMKASELPYQEAFAVEVLPDVPTSLVEQVEALVRVSNDEHFVEKKKSWFFAASLCIAFIAGGLLIQSVLTLPSALSSYHLSEYGSKPLIDAMVQYQALYTRETIASVKQPPPIAEKVIQEFNDSTNSIVSIADFSSEGYEFRRAQELSYGDNKIMQMVYLAKSGKPIALCATNSNIVQSEMMHYQYAGMNSILWVKDGTAYMLMGDENKLKLKMLYESIIENKTIVSLL